MGAAREWKLHWPLVLATTAGMALASMLTSAFGVMLEPIEQETGWTRAQISSGPAIVSMMGLFLAAPAGHLIDKLGAWRTGVFVVLVSFVSMMTLSMVGSALWQWWAAWAIFGIPAAFTSTVWLAPVSTTFDRGRGLAIAVTLAGTGISMALVPGIAEYFVQKHSWRTGYLVLGLIWCGITLPLVIAFVPRMRKRPKGAAHSPDEPQLALATGFGPREGFKSGTFYLLFFASLLSAVTGVAIILNLVPVLTFTGLTRLEAVAIAGSMGIASIIGRLVGGWLMDIYSVKWLAVGASIVSLVFPLGLILFPGVVWAATIATIGYGLTGGMKLNAIVYLCRTHLGARSFGLFYGTISTTTTIAMGIGPLVANYVYDETMSYWPVIWAAVPGFLIAGLLFAFLGKEPDFGERGQGAQPARHG